MSGPRDAAPDPLVWPETLCLNFLTPGDAQLAKKLFEKVKGEAYWAGARAAREQAAKDAGGIMDKRHHHTEDRRVVQQVIHNSRLEGEPDAE